jgi:Flp pilus assembly protein TadG
VSLTSRARAAVRSDRGTVIPLILGYLVVVSALLLVVIDGTVLFLASRSLGTYADGAALAAAQQIDKKTLYAGTGIVDDTNLPLDQQAQDAARQYLTEAGAFTRFQDLQVEVSVNGRGSNEVRVSITAPGVHIPFTNLVGHSDGVRMSNTATAVLRCDTAGRVGCN